ncbi:hypothetical protein EGO56_09680 [Pantoea vagans]|nr:hypothetical protein EGO56_09680 [Pantoea vagans]
MANEAVVSDNAENHASASEQAVSDTSPVSAVQSESQAGNVSATKTSTAPQSAPQPESSSPASPAPSAPVTAQSDADSTPQSSKKDNATAALTSDSASSSQNNEAPATAAPEASTATPAAVPQKPDVKEAAQPQPEKVTSDAEQPAAAKQPAESASGATDTSSQPLVAPDKKTTDANKADKSTTGNAAGSEALFTPEQEARIGEVAKAYLLKHPELLIEVDQKLQQLQHEEQRKVMTSAVLQHQDALLNDKSVPSIGPADAKVVFTEFFDYQCSVCSHQAPVIKSLMKNNPQVRFVFKEWPIFGYRWKPSLKAAETGLKIWQQKGGDAYMNYHDALFATNHTEGQLTQSDINKAASAAGASKLKAKDEQEMLSILARTDALAQNLGFQGTPGMIVMPASGASMDNVTIFPGGTDEKALQDAISKASGQQKK